MVWPRGSFAAQWPRASQLVHSRPRNRALPSKICSRDWDSRCSERLTSRSGDIVMAIDFTPTAQQRDQQRVSRKFANEVLGEAKAAELLATPEERFLAIKPTYEAMVAAG